MRFKDKSVIITGGATGIGKATALLFAEEGANVVITSRTESKLEAVEDEANEKGLNVSYFVADVSKEANCIDSVEHTIKKFGKVDILFNNAGVIYPGMLHETELKDFNKIFDINVKGTFMMSKYTIPYMIRNNGGSIVNNSSVVGLKGFPGISAYVASKDAVTQLTRSMALEYADKGIKVNAVCPGAVWTPMVDSFIERSEDPKESENYMTSFHPIGRLGYDSEIAHSVLFICSDNVKFMTGTMLSVDGGWIAT